MWHFPPPWNCGPHISLTFRRGSRYITRGPSTIYGQGQKIQFLKTIVPVVSKCCGKNRLLLGKYFVCSRRAYVYATPLPILIFLSQFLCASKTEIAGGDWSNRDRGIKISVSLTAGRFPFCHWDDKGPAHPHWCLTILADLTSDQVEWCQQTPCTDMSCPIFDSRDFDLSLCGKHRCYKHYQWLCST